MASKIYSAAVVGLDAVPVEVEADISRGFPKFTIVGLPDTAVQEARERVRSAIRNSGLPFPRPKLTVNLAPADIKKEGPAYDLPIAIALLEAGAMLEQDAAEKQSRLFIGELALDGSLRPVSGVLPIALMASERGFKELYVPEQNAGEAIYAAGISVFAIKNLSQLLLHLRKEAALAPSAAAQWPAVQNQALAEYDFAFVKGQMLAKRSLEIAAAGGHNVLLSGPPGAGKTLLAKSLPTILPELTREEILEVTKIYSVAGLTGEKLRIITERPFRSPHHTASGVALIGGGTWPKPGEVSLAHRGVLFLDEFPEFSRAALENLRQPMEDGHVTVSRASGSIRFPAKFMLIAAQNPCPCGFASDELTACSCSPAHIMRYRKKISGPLLDRIDLHVEVPKISAEEFFGVGEAEPSKSIREKVKRARETQRTRFKDAGIFTNAEMSQKLLKSFCPASSEIDSLLRAAVERLKLSGRALSRILKVSRTIADLSGDERVSANHVAEALHFREVQTVVV